jgi:hypothetical protein
MYVATKFQLCIVTDATQLTASPVLPAIHISTEKGFPRAPSPRE